jgi:WD40 repeat protein
MIEVRSGGGVGAASKINVLGKNKPIVEESTTVILCETSTSILLSLPSFIVASDTRDVIHTDERNARYEACLKAHKNVDGFNGRSTQTKNNQLKNANEMAAPNAFREYGCQAISYEIKDEIISASTTNTENDLVAPGLAVGTDTSDDLNGLNNYVKKFVSDTVGVALVTPGCLLDTSTAVKPPAPGEYNTVPKVKGGGKGGNKSVVSQKSVANSEAPSEDEGYGFSVANKTTTGGGGKSKAAANQEVSTASSGNNSTPDAAIPSGSKANMSQSNAGDSNMDNSEDGGGGGSRSGGHHFTEEDSLQILRENEIKRILGSPLLLKRLHMIERAIQQNANYRNQLDYRDLPDILPLQLISADRMKALGEGNDQHYGSGLGGKSSMANLKRTFTSRTQSISHGLSVGHEGSGLLNDDTRSVHSASDGGGEGGNANSSSNNSVKLKAENLFSFDSSSKVKKLFCYANPDLIQGRSVTSMTWNATSTDLLAVGYGRSLDLKKFQPASSSSSGHEGKSHGGGGVSEAKEKENKEGANAAAREGGGKGEKEIMIPNNNTDIPTDEAQEGLVLFWSLRNPDYPEKILRTPHSVTAVEFSKQNPMILAVGLVNGDVNVYDVKREANWGIPIESSSGMEGSHMDPVWQLKWIVKGAERLETLVSISTDGRVLEWNLKKGLVMSKLMQLKKSGTGEGWISNSSAGLCFDFSPADSTTYVTGTEDGNIFRCSVSYNEQYLETYQNHEAPVYRVKFSNRWPNVFLSCSADWSMNLYHLSVKQSLLSIRATAETFPVNDVCWCPDNATVSFPYSLLC